jgi:hypothetical protein
MAELARFSTDLSARAGAASHAHASATAAELHTHVARRGLDLQHLLERHTGEIQAVSNDTRSIAQLLNSMADLQQRLRTVEHQTGGIQAVRSDTSGIAELLTRTIALQEQFEAAQHRLQHVERQTGEIQGVRDQVRNINQQLDRTTDERARAEETQRRLRELELEHERALRLHDQELRLHNQALSSATRIYTDEFNQETQRHDVAAEQWRRTQRTLRHREVAQAQRLATDDTMLQTQIEQRHLREQTASSAQHGLALQSTIRILGDESHQREREHNLQLTRNRHQMRALQIQHARQHLEPSVPQRVFTSALQQTLIVERDGHLQTEHTLRKRQQRNVQRVDEAARREQGQHSAAPPTPDYALLDRLVRAETEKTRLETERLRSEQRDAHASSTIRTLRTGVAHVLPTMAQSGTADSSQQASVMQNLRRGLPHDYRRGAVVDDVEDMDEDEGDDKQGSGHGSEQVHTPVPPGAFPDEFT